MAATTVTLMAMVVVAGSTSSKLQCTFNNDKFPTASNKFYIKTVGNNMILRISHPYREFIAQEYDDNLRSWEYYFSACKGNRVLDLQHKAKGDTFEMCQAGYPERKLLYDTRTGSFYVVPKTKHHTGHHEIFEAVIYEPASSSSSHTRFYIRPKNATFHNEVIVVHDHADHRVSETGHVRSTKFRHPWVVNPHNVTELTHALFKAHPED